MHDSIAAVELVVFNHLFVNPHNQNTILSIELKLFVFTLPCGGIKVHNDFL